MNYGKILIRKNIQCSLPRCCVLVIGEHNDVACPGHVDCRSYWRQSTTLYMGTLIDTFAYIQCAMLRPHCRTCWTLKVETSNETYFCKFSIKAQWSGTNCLIKKQKTNQKQLYRIHRNWLHCVIISLIWFASISIRYCDILIINIRYISSFLCHLTEKYCWPLDMEHAFKCE